MSAHASPDGIPFSLICEGCDAGLEFESYEAAVAAGWRDIMFAPDLPMANFVGLCPDCRASEQSTE